MSHNALLKEREELLSWTEVTSYDSPMMTSSPTAQCLMLGDVTMVGDVIAVCDAAFR